MNTSSQPEIHACWSSWVTLCRVGEQVICRETDLSNGRHHEHGPRGRFVGCEHLQNRSVVKLVRQAALADRAIYPLARQFCNQHPDTKWHLPRPDFPMTVEFRSCEHTTLSLRELGSGTIVLREQLVADGSVREVLPEEPLYGCTGYENKNAVDIVRGTHRRSAEPVVEIMASRFCQQHPDPRFHFAPMELRVTVVIRTCEHCVLSLVEREDGSVLCRELNLATDREEYAAPRDPLYACDRYEHRHAGNLVWHCCRDTTDLETHYLASQFLQRDKFGPQMPLLGQGAAQ